MCEGKAKISHLGSNARLFFACMNGTNRAIRLQTREARYEEDTLGKYRGSFIDGK
jgi:hypothetical protein